MRLHSLVAIFAVLSFANSLQGREWTDYTGRHRSEAELVHRVGDTVWLTDSTGRRRWVDFQRLSAADQEFIIQHQGEAASKAGPDTKPQSIVKTLGYRQSKPVSENRSQLMTAAADTSVFKLTGWSHCTPWYCHHPHPHHPVLPNPLPVPGKRIYCGHWSTWHLVRQQAGAISGSGTFLVNIPPIARHLVLLQYIGLSGGGAYLHYWAVSPPPNSIQHWRFGNSVVGSCWYRVEYWNAGWKLYEYCRVKLPG